jgi:hypothetical protein
MGLILHAGANLVSYDELRAVPLPATTDTHWPVAHHEIVELVRYTLGFYQHEIAEEHHAIMPDGMRYFGLMTLRGPYGNYGDVVGLRNSHDKSFPVGIAFGSRVFVCDNTAFVGEHVIRRRHTAKARRELPGLLAEIVAPLHVQREAQNQKFVTYQQERLTDRQSDHAIMEMYRRHVIGVRRIADVHQQWQNPAHDWGDKTAWRLFNAATFALAGRIVEKPDLTRRLHQVIDGACESGH